MNAIKMVVLAILATVFAFPAMAADQQVTPQMMKEYEPGSNLCTGAQSQQHLAKLSNTPLPGYLKERLQKCELVAQVIMKERAKRPLFTIYRVDRKQ